MASVSLCIDSSFHSAVNEELKKISQAQTRYADSSLYPIDTFTVLDDLVIETVRHIQDCTSFHPYPKNGRIPDIIFVFSQAVAINKEYRVGDLVIATSEQPTLADKLISSQIRSELAQNLPALKAEPFDYKEMSKKVLALLDTERKDWRDIARELEIPDAKRQPFFQNVMRPYSSDDPVIEFDPENAFWQRSTDKTKFFLTPRGQEVKRTLQPESPSERKASLFVGSSYCDPDAIRSRLPDGGNNELIDQVSSLTFRNLHDLAPRTLHVCVIKCLEGEDLEKQTPYEQSIAKTIVAFVTSVCAKWRTGVFSDAASSSAGCRV